MKKLLIVICVFISLESRSQALYFPSSTGNAWDTLSPATLGWCDARIDSLYDYLNTTNTNAFIVLKDGKIVLEKYFGTFTQDSIHYWASAAKGLTAMMVGIAQQRGLLNINDSVSTYLGGGWTSETPAKEKLITVRNLLTMTSGMNENPAAPCDNDNFSQTCLQYKVDAGTRWTYHTGAYKKLEAVVSVVSGKTYNEATNDFIQTSTGMNGAWTPSGVFYSKARDMARFGLLMLNKGVWQKDTILNDSVFFNAMTNTSQNFNLSYGYLWWLNGKASTMLPGTQLVFPSSLLPNAPADMYCALGKNDQKIYVVPSKNMVVIRMGESAYAEQALSPYDAKIWSYINKLGDNCLTTGLADKKTTVELKLFPNPASHFISFTGIPEERNIHYSIVNTSGVKVIEGDTFNHSINIMDLESGMYYLTLQSPDMEMTRQFVKK